MTRKQARNSIGMRVRFFVDPPNPRTREGTVIEDVTESGSVLRIQWDDGTIANYGSDHLQVIS